MIKPYSFTLDKPDKSEYPELLSIWEKSVRATHHFLKEEDVIFLRKLIEENTCF